MIVALRSSSQYSSSVAVMLTSCNTLPPPDLVSPSHSSISPFALQSPEIIVSSSSDTCLSLKNHPYFDVFCRFACGGIASIMVMSQHAVFSLLVYPFLLELLMLDGLKAIVPV